MLYYIQPGDTLNKIARRNNITVQDILNTNVICNPNMVVSGQPIIVPQQGIDLPKAGGHPYYVVMPGDSLGCIAAQFGTNVKAMAEGNQMKNPNLLHAGSELLVAYDRPDPVQLKNQWQSMGGVPCVEMSPQQLYGVYYIGTFMWQSLGDEAIPYLLELLKHPCPEVRYYTAISLGRIATERASAALKSMLRDPDKNVANIAALALKRVNLVKDIGKRIHVTKGSNKLLANPISTAPFKTLPEGTPVITVKWRIPSPTGEEGPRGDIQLYDLVQVVSTGQFGFLPRLGFDEIMMI